MGVAERFLADTCSSLLYLLDRGEFNDELADVREHIRYTNVTELDSMHVVYAGREIEVTARDLGAHVHTWVSSKYGDKCSVCRALDDE